MSFISFFKKNKLSPEEKYEPYRNTLGEEWYQKNVNQDKLKEEYKKYTDEFFVISSSLTENNTYSKAIKQQSIFNKYSEKYIESCNKLLQLLPYKLEFEKQYDKVSGFEERSYNYCYSNILNFIKLLEKQEKYDKIIQVCNYLLSLGITEDGTKNGIKGRIEKAKKKKDDLKECK